MLKMDLEQTGRVNRATAILTVIVSTKIKIGGDLPSGLFECHLRAKGAHRCVS